MSYLMHKYDKTLPRKKVLLQEPFFIHKIICLIYNNLVNIFTKFYFWNIMYLSGCSTLPNKKIKYLFVRGVAHLPKILFLEYLSGCSTLPNKKIKYLFVRGVAHLPKILFLEYHVFIGM